MCPGDTDAPPPCCKIRIFSQTKATRPHSEWICIAGAHLQCMNNHYAKFEYKGMKSV